ncbi:MAG: DUF5916 domain-containing protein [Vicinamibacterales bacterium]
MRTAVWLSSIVFGLSVSAQAQTPQKPLPIAPIHISRASGPIKIDGDLSDAAWRTATRVEKWYEIQPGDNTEPPVKSVGYLTYDARFFYAAFDFEDPDPSSIRAPLGDHDDISGTSMDFGGVFIDALNTGRTALEFFVTPSNVQYDAVTDDASGENPSPDFFWDSATKRTSHGWTLEMRIPFSTLRYRQRDPKRWGIILFRNYPRQFRHQIVSTTFPRGGNCTVCRSNPLAGLQGLPSGGHIVAAPYVSGSDTATPQGGVLGAPLSSGSPHGRVGIDVKYNPNADTAIDATIKPDFSQIESDTAQISANQRFALFYPEKRPFFLEGVDLFQTPIQAVYTRTITDPLWGGRVTGRDGGVRYTALVAEDAGGGTVVLPGSNGSSSAPQDFSSTVFVGRAKKELGRSFVGALMTDRETTDVAAQNRVAGPDFEWRPNSADVVTGQWLLSDTRTPNRPDLAEEWDGGTMTGSALQTGWTHSTRHLDWGSSYSDLSGGFRADTGFVPQVGYRQFMGSTGWSVHPTGIVSSERTFVNVQYQRDDAGQVITENVQPGVSMNTRWNGSTQLQYVNDRTRAGDALIGRQQFVYFLQVSPSRRVSLLSVNSTVGQDIDFANARPATGLTLNLEATIQPTIHLAIDAIEDTRTLHVSVTSPDQRLFVQRVTRVKGTYTFTARLFVRVIGQYVATTSDPSLYLTPVPARAGDFSGSALFAFKLNWQSVMFVGYGDDRELSDIRRLEPLDRQLFVKLSYAFQR